MQLLQRNLWGCRTLSTNASFVTSAPKGSFNLPPRVSNALLVRAKEGDANSASSGPEPAPINPPVVVAEVDMEASTSPEAKSPSPQSSYEGEPLKASKNDFDESPLPESSASPSPASADFVRESRPSPTSGKELTSHAVAFKDGEIKKGDNAEDFFASEELIEELKTGFGQKGEAWFFAQAAILVLIAFCPFQLQGFLDMLGTLSVTSGAVFIAYSLVSLGRNLSPMPLPRQQHSLVTSGMYEYARHPMYGGALLACLGLVIMSRSETRLLLLLVLLFVLDRKADIEEKALVEKYGEQYESYRLRVKKFIPFIF